ncbi:MAG: LysM peptidoglycan-binding domain-containing protein [Mycobacterium sp.]
MTILDTREARNDFVCEPQRDVRGAVRARVVDVPRLHPAAATRRPCSPRPLGARVHRSGTGLPVSRVSHRRRPVTPATTVVLALIAGAITLWLGLVAQFGGVVGSEAEIHSRLAVVQVQAGESLQQVAQRVAPDAPVGDVIERIRELNELETVALNAGQTLIAPVS